MRQQLKHTATYIIDDKTKNYSRTFDLKDNATKDQAKSLALEYENFLTTPDEHSADYVTYDAIDLDE